jgi:hypothetical protein
MRFRLRTLLILLAVGPPLLAFFWFFRKAIFVLCCLAVELLPVAFLAAAAFGIPLVVAAFMLSRIADAVLYFARHPDNRR